MCTVRLSVRSWWSKGLFIYAHHMITENMPCSPQSSIHATYIWIEYSVGFFTTMNIQSCICGFYYRAMHFSASWLRLNPTKTQVMRLGSSQQLDISHVRVLLSCVKLQDTARDLGIVIDSQLSLSAHVAAVCRSGYYQLRQAVRSLSEDASKTLIQAFVSCCPDYCNSLFFGISEGLMN